MFDLVLATSASYSLKKESDTNLLLAYLEFFGPSAAASKNYHREMDYYDEVVATINNNELEYELSDYSDVYELAEAAIEGIFSWLPTEDGAKHSNEMLIKFFDKGKYIDFMLDKNHWIETSYGILERKTNNE